MKTILCLLSVCVGLFSVQAGEFNAAAELRQCPQDAQIRERIGRDLAVNSYEAELLLLHAVIQGRFALAGALLEAGCRVNSENAAACLEAACGACYPEHLPDGELRESGRAPGTVKARPGQAEIVRALLQRCCAVYDGNALSVAVRSGDAATVQCLLYYGALPDDEVRQLAEKMGNPEMVALLQAADFYTDEGEFLAALEEMPHLIDMQQLEPYLGQHHKARAILMHFLRIGRFEEARALLPYVKGVNFRLFRPLVDGMTPLLHACGEGEYGGDFGHEYAPHADFARPGQAAMIRALLAAGADPNFPREFNLELPIIKAARTGDIESVRLLLAAGADVHARDREGKCALDYAAEDGQIFMVRYLLGLPGMPPAELVQVSLAGAVEFNRAVCVQELIRAGSLEGVGEAERRELLKLAASSHAAESFVLLHEAGLDIHALHEGLNPLGHLLMSYIWEEERALPLLRYMIAEGLHQHVPSARKALSSAVSMGLPEIADLLLAAGANVEDSAFASALLKDAAGLREESRRQAVLEVLQKHGIRKGD